jgi:membrane protease subunit HflK
VNRRVLWIAGIVLPSAAYVASGLTILQPDEVGIVRRFGAAEREPWEPGLHWGLPWGIDHVDRIKLNETRTVAAGAPSPTGVPLLRTADPASDDYLTGDLNLITAGALVQYRVRDPSAFLFRSTSTDESVSAVAEWGLTRAFANRGIDELLTTGRADVADGLTRLIQSHADELGLGISIVAIRLGRVAPPAAVEPAFADAARARSDRRQAVTRAEEYRDRARSDARGQAREIANAAAGRVDRIVEPARGEADRFTKLVAEAHKAPEALRQRLYLETLAELLPRFRRSIVVAPGQDLDITLFGIEPSPRAKEAGQ